MGTIIFTIWQHYHDAPMNGSWFCFVHFGRLISRHIHKRHCYDCSLFLCVTCRSSMQNATEPTTNCIIAVAQLSFRFRCVYDCGYTFEHIWCVLCMLCNFAYFEQQQKQRADVDNIGKKRRRVIWCFFSSTESFIRQICLQICLILNKFCETPPFSCDCRKNSYRIKALLDQDKEKGSRCVPQRELFTERVRNDAKRDQNDACKHDL